MLVSDALSCGGRVRLVSGIGRFRTAGSGLARDRHSRTDIADTGGYGAAPSGRRPNHGLRVLNCRTRAGG